MISQQIESFVTRLRKGDAETLSLMQTAALRAHLTEFIEESDLGELSSFLSCYPTKNSVYDALESMTYEAERAIRRLYDSGRCLDKGEDELIL